MQSSVHLAEGFQRRRLKCEKLTVTTKAKKWRIKITSLTCDIPVLAYFQPLKDLIFCHVSGKMINNCY
jgi:hypothetical protein